MQIKRKGKKTEYVSGSESMLTLGVLSPNKNVSNMPSEGSTDPRMPGILVMAREAQKDGVELMMVDGQKRVGNVDRAVAGSAWLRRVNK